MDSNLSSQKSRSRGPKQISTALSPSDEKMKEHINAVLQGVTLMAFDAATSKCKCSVCDAVRELSPDIRVFVEAIMKAGRGVKKISAVTPPVP